MTLDLRKLEAQTAYFDANGRPTMQFQIFWQQTIEAIEAQEAIQDQALADIQTALTNAGIALATAQASMPDVPPTTINADYTGTIGLGQLPRNIQVRRFDDLADVTASSAWSATTDSGSIAYTIGASTGIINVTAIDSSSVINAVSVYNGVTRSRKVSVNKEVAAPSSTGTSGGTTATNTGFGTVSATSMAAISDDMTVTVGTAGEVSLNAPLVTHPLDTTNGTYAVYGVWQWYDGASWVDLGTEVLNAVAATVADGGDIVDDGYMPVSYIKTGLAPAASEKFRLMARYATFHTGSTTFFGTASAVGS
jgi:hypothetical protein